MNKNLVMLEDDSDDRYLTSEILHELGITIPVRFFTNSGELQNYLAQAEKPSLIVLDDNSIPEDGISILKWLKEKEEFRNIPVVILSSNDLPKYRDEAYRAGAVSFIQKPASMEETKKKIGTFFRYWFEVAEV